MKHDEQNELCNVVFESTIGDWSEVNSSFDHGVLRIAYHGPNRNKMFISKQAFDDAIKSVFNCPVVCNYIRETDSIGAHDVDIVKKDGEVRMVNATTPVGVVPESANVWWSEVTEANGEVHEYLCTDILIWKRQEAYEHLKKNEITDESMEIRIISGHKKDDGLYHIDQFEFLAFCLLESAPPCFESASIELFALNEFKTKYALMMEDMKREFTTVMTASADDIRKQSCSKGGKFELDVNKLMIKYSISAEDITFDTAGMPIDELERKFAEIKATKGEAAAFVGDGGEGSGGEDDSAGGTPEGSGDGDPEGGSAADPQGGSEENPEGGEGSGEDTPGDPTGENTGEDPSGDSTTDEDAEEDDTDRLPENKRKQNYSLTAHQFVSELCDALNSVRYNDPYWGDMCKYCFMDYDAALGEVYVIDMEDYKLYGIPFSMNGDKVVVDFAHCKRKKVCYVDFDNGDAEFAEKHVFANLIPQLQEKFKVLGDELQSLRAFKAKVDEQARKEEAERVFSMFADLSGNAEFKALQENYGNMSADQIEEKCFAIRGRNMSANFSLDSQIKPIRLPIDAQARHDAEEPYNGIFAKYGIGNR